MTRMIPISRFLLICCAGLILATPGFSVSAQMRGLTVTPDIVELDMFFSGGRVTISGELPSKGDVVVEIRGPRIACQFDLKGRVGPFWLTRGDVCLENAPLLSLLLLPDGKEWEERSAALGLGLSQVRKEVKISEGDLSPEEVFRLFVDLKTREGLYGVQAGAVSYSSAANGARRFTAGCDLPSSTAPGKYEIMATHLVDGVAGQTLSGGLTVKEVGFIKFLNGLANNQRLIYGVLAVVIALFTGSFMGVLFKQRGGGH